MINNVNSDDVFCSPCLSVQYEPHALSSTAWLFKASSQQMYLCAWTPLVGLFVGTSAICQERPKESLFWGLRCSSFCWVNSQYVAWHLNLPVVSCSWCKSWVTLQIPTATKIPNQNGHGQAQEIRSNELWSLVDLSLVLFGTSCSQRYPTPQRRNYLDFFEELLAFSPPDRQQENLQSMTW